VQRTGHISNRRLDFSHEKDCIRVVVSDVRFDGNTVCAGALRAGVSASAARADNGCASTADG
jgi:hypothetical protein